MALGKVLQDARNRKRMTTSQVAAATRMKIQTIEAIEREDFTHITAPVYGKGFLRLFAECVEIDPKPLIDEYMDRYAPRKQPSLVGEGPPPRRITEEPVFGPDEVQPEPAKTPAVQPDLFAPANLPPRSGEKKDPQGELWDRPVESAAERMWEPESTVSSPISGGNPFKNRSVFAFLKYLSIVAGVIVILAFVISGVSRWLKKSEAQNPVAQQQSPPPAPVKPGLRVAVDPPAPYVD